MGLGNSPIPHGAGGTAIQKHSNRLSGRCWLFWLLLLSFDWSSTGFKSFKPQLWSENEVRCLRNSCWKQLGSLWSLWLASKQLPEGREASELSWACMCCGKTKRLSLNKAWLGSLCWRIQVFPPTLLYVFNKELTVPSLFFWALETREDQSNQF